MLTDFRMSIAVLERVTLRSLIRAAVVCRGAPGGVPVTVALVDRKSHVLSPETALGLSR